MQTSKSRIVKIWDRLLASFWFLPVIMSAVAIVMSQVTLALEKPVEEILRGWGWGLSGGTEGAIAVMASVTGSMITIAGVVFSMTLVALSLTSSQLGPRLLRNFMRDIITQYVLGTFVATFIYCLLILRTIGQVNGKTFVPHVSISFGVLLAVFSIGVVIFFIHHVSVSIQANVVVARVGAELISAIERLSPAPGANGQAVRMEKPDTGFLDRFAGEARPIPADGDGYLQIIDRTGLVELAVEADAVFRVDMRPGHYVIAGAALVHVWPADAADEHLTNRINALFVVGHERMPRQDLEFSVNQLVEIAVRALSPGINDPFTAIACIDRLGSALSRLVQRDPPQAFLHDREGRLRVLDAVLTFATIADTAFNQIRQYGRSSAAVAIRLLETIAIVARHAARPEDVAVLLRHAEMIASGARDALPEEQDLRIVESCRLAVKRLHG